MQFDQLRRREFISLLGGAAAWPLAARAQQKPVIGFLNSGSADAYPDRITAFHEGLRQLGYIEGENVLVDYRWALGEYDRLPAFAAELVERRVSVLIATGGKPAALAAKSATSTIPIVFAIGGDPIKLGLVTSYNRPGGNATGANILAAEMDGKRLELLHELMPNAAHVGLLLNPNFPAYPTQLNELQQAAAIMGLQVDVLRANTDGEIEADHVAETHRSIGTSGIPILRHSTGQACCSGGRSRAAHDLSFSRIRCGWRLDELRCQHSAHISPSRCLRRPHSQRRESCQSASTAANDLRTSRQFENR